MKYILINIYIYISKTKKILKMSAFGQGLYDLKSWLIVSKGQLSARGFPAKLK